MPLTLEQIARMVKGKLTGNADTLITGAAPLYQANEGDIAFEEKRMDAHQLDAINASAIIVHQGMALPNHQFIEVSNPRLAFAMVLGELYAPSRPATGAHPTATIGANCILDEEVTLAEGVVIGNKVKLGKGVILYPNVVVGDNVCIGDDTVVHPQVSISEGCQLGRGVLIHAGTVIGSDGFGFVFDEGRYHKIPQVGIVQIDDDVEIGSNCSIDRAALGKTWIKTGVKIDNQVHIAHNVIIGEHTAITAQVGIAGSATLGRYVQIAGQAGIKGHITIGDQVTIGPQAAVTKPVPDKAFVSGTTLAMKHQTWLRQQRILPDLPDLYKRVGKLEKRIAHLESDPTQNKS